MTAITHPLFDHPVVSGYGALSVLATELQQQADRKYLILCDEGTQRHCLPLLLREVPALSAAAVMGVPQGEPTKTVAWATRIWEEMTRLGLGREDLLINLGGGMISDLGGFAAATYLRGIPFLHVPTSLLGQVDAAIGGKTGLDLNGAKNRVGLTAFPQGVYADTRFYDSLPDEEWSAATAEVVKHALVGDPDLWQYLLAEGLGRAAIALRLSQIQQVKIRVVALDPYESGIRRILNFGHTCGHALESAALTGQDSPLSHGRAVAIGMMLELELAFRLELLNADDFRAMRAPLEAWFGTPDLRAFVSSELLHWMRLDKKNAAGAIGCSLVTTPGNCTFRLVHGEEHFLRVLTDNGARP